MASPTYQLSRYQYCGLLGTDDINRRAKFVIIKDGCILVYDSKEEQQLKHTEVINRRPELAILLPQHYTKHPEDGRITIYLTTYGKNFCVDISAPSADEYNRFDRAFEEASDVTWTNIRIRSAIRNLLAINRSLFDKNMPNDIDDIPFSVVVDDTSRINSKELDNLCTELAEEKINAEEYKTKMTELIQRLIWAKVVGQAINKALLATSTEVNELQSEIKVIEDNILSLKEEKAGYVSVIFEQKKGCSKTEALSKMKEVQKRIDDGMARIGHAKDRLAVALRMAKEVVCCKRKIDKHILTLMAEAQTFFATSVTGAEAIKCVERLGRLVVNDKDIPVPVTEIRRLALKDIKILKNFCEIISLKAEMCKPDRWNEVRGAFCDLMNAREAILKQKAKKQAH